MVQREPMSYLSGQTGIVEGVDILEAEVHHPAVNAVEISTPGGVAGDSAPFQGWSWGARSRRHHPQEPGQQRAKRREWPAAPHGGGCSAPAAG